MSRITPSLHLPVPLQTRCRVDAQYLGKEVTGVVGGIASCHVVFHYIVILDEPHVEPESGETFTAISVLGSHLMDESGKYAWRLTPQEAYDRAVAEAQDRIVSGLDKPTEQRV
jgi:hypothetical protein